MTQFSPIKCALGGVMLAVAAWAQAGSYSGLVVFGDSLSDSGNNAALLAAFGPGAAPLSNTDFSKLPYASGRYSNGPVWTEYFAAKMGLPLTPSGVFGAPGYPSFGGNNYAFGGAETSADGVDGPGGFPFSMTKQLGMFLGDPSKTVSGNELFIISGGGNNVRVALDQLAGAQSQAEAFAIVGKTAADYALDIGNMVDALQERGAKHILVVNTPNFGLTPMALSLGFSGQFWGSKTAEEMDAKLHARLAGEAGVQAFDMYAFMTQTVMNGAALGLSNVTDACGQVALNCDLSTSLFYDAIHPTTKGHQLMADAIYAVAAVPEPATYAMFGLGVAVLAWARRRQVGNKA